MGVKDLVIGFSLVAGFGSLAAGQEAWAWGWVHVVNGSIPSNAVNYGIEGNYSIVCGNWYGDGSNSGRIVGNRCVFSYKGEEKVMDDYYVLVTENGYQWIEYTKYQEPPENALYNSTAARNPKTYICGTQHNGYYLTGQILDEGRCHVTLNGKDYYFGYYMIPLAY